jgi:branched-chain amino acid transport system substrate-binding protein
VIRRRHIATVAALAATCAAVAACGSSSGSTSASTSGSGTIKIGVANPATGPDASPQYKPSVELAAQKINAKGGVDGKKIVLDVQDNGSTAASGLTAARQFVQDKVAAVIGYSTTVENLALTPTFKAAKMINMVGTASADNDYDKTGDPYTFVFNVGDPVTAKHQVDFALDNLHAKRFALLLDSTDFGQSFGKVVTPIIKANGGSVVATQNVNPTANDLSTQVSKILDAKPDVILVALLTPGTTQLMYQELQKQAPNSQPPLIGAAALVPELGTAVPWSQAKKTYATYMTQGMYNPSARAASATDWYNAVGPKVTKLNPNDSAAEAYDSLLAVAAAIKATGGTDPDKLAAYLSGLKNFKSFNGIPTVSGPYTCDPKTHQCLFNQYMGEVKGDALVQVAHYSS